MLDTKTQTQEEADLWNEASNPPEKTYDLFGKVDDLTVFKGAYQSGIRGAVPYDPAIHQKGHTFVKFYIQPLPEIDVKYPNTLTYESPVWGDWGKVTFPSIKALGVADAREIANRYARFARVPNGKKYPKKDAMGNLTGEEGDEMTWKFVAFFADEDECRAAYIAAGGKSDGNGNANGNSHAQSNALRKPESLTIMKAVIANVKPGKTTYAEVVEAIKAHAFYATISADCPVDSPEVEQLITEMTDLLPF